MKILKNFSLIEYNSYRLSSHCNKAYFPESENELISLFREYKDKPLIVLGHGNNVILSKEWYDECFVVFNGCYGNIEVNGSEISAEAGASMHELSEIAFQHNLSGIEIFYDIPSSVGGAVVMNAGAGKEEISDLLSKVRYLDINTMNVGELDINDIHYEYRNSIFQKETNKIVLKAWFRLKPGSSLTIRKKMEDTKRTRWAKQPREFPNCGSVFKRPKGHYVGKMIKDLGLKGMTIGDAKISEKHGGFIINTGNATGCDILKIIEKTKEIIKNKYGVELEIEQRII